MKKYYDIELAETNGDGIDWAEAKTKAQALKICKQFASRYPKEDFINDKYWIKVQICCGEQDCDDYEYGEWINILSYNVEKGIIE